jgi:hypothetical protein
VRPGLAATATLLAVVALAGCGDDDGAAPESREPPAGETTTTAPSPAVDVDVQGPITGGRFDLPYNPAPDGLLAEHGYLEEEWFLSGHATAYAGVGELHPDGRWEVEEVDTAPYTTRVLVRRPEDPAAFNGTVVVEWLNVTAGRDSDPDFGALHPVLLGEGYAYVAVSAQQVAVEGGAGRLEIPGVDPEALAPLKVWDPERYGTLAHPGDEFSYDIFSQAAQWLRSRGAHDPLDGLEVDHVLAVGQSQSAARLLTQINAVHPVTEAFDGYLVHGRSASPAPLADGTELPGRVLIRDDLDAAVLQVQTETDVVSLGSHSARQPDTDRVVTWEIAGAAHADQEILDYGLASGRRWAPEASAGLDAEALCGSVNTGPQGPVLRAALARLREWVVDGQLPPSAPSLETTEDGQIVRDEVGIALGGVRTPPVDVPTSVLTGEGSPASVFCMLFGQTFPLPAEELAARYGTTADLVEQTRASARAAVAAGFLLDADADAMVDAAGQVGW